jgi:hypothetical protein
MALPLVDLPTLIFHADPVGVGTDQTFLDQFAGRHAAFSPAACLATYLPGAVARVTPAKRGRQVRNGSK